MTGCLWGEHVSILLEICEVVACDVCGSMHHIKIHIEKSNKMQQCMKIYYSIFI
jgi:hypothetical protein